MPLAGAPRDLYTQLLACSSSQSVVAIACCLRASLCLRFSHPSLPLGGGLGKCWVGKYSTELFSVTVLHQLCGHQRPSSSIGDEFK